jgi:hypothetical protein
MRLTALLFDALSCAPHQNMTTILLMNSVGMTNHQQQQFGFGNNSTTNNQQRQNEGDKGKSKE